MAETEVPPPLEERLTDDDDTSGSNSSEDDDDDEPPSLGQLTINSPSEKQSSIPAQDAQQQRKQQQGDDGDTEGPSLRDLMQQEAEAEARKKKAREEKEKKRMAKSFGQGFKLKGFFNRKKNNKKNKTTTSAGSKPKNPDLPYVKANSSAGDSDINSLRLPEVQEALKKAFVSHAVWSCVSAFIVSLAIAPFVRIVCL